LMPGGPGLALISSRAKLRLRPAARDFGVASTRVCAPQESLQRELTGGLVGVFATISVTLPEYSNGDVQPSTVKWAQWRGRTERRRSRIYGRARPPTSAPTRIATSASVRPSRPSPGVPATSSWVNTMIRLRGELMPSRRGQASVPCSSASPATACIPSSSRWPNRFARDLIVQETGHRMLRQKAI